MAAKETKKKLGRPSVFTPEMISKLESAFMIGLSDRQACLYAGIGETTLTRYCSDNEDFRARKELLKQQPHILAKMAIHRALDEEDEQTAKWFLERRDEDFKTKTRQEIDHTTSDGSMSPPTVIEIVAGVPDDTA